MDTISLVEYYLLISFFKKIAKLNWPNRARAIDIFPQPVRQGLYHYIFFTIIIIFFPFFLSLNGKFDIYPADRV